MIFFTLEKCVVRCIIDLEVMKMLGVQLYTLRNCLNNDDNIRMTAKKLKEMGCLSVQLFHGEKELEKMCEIFSSEGIEIIGTLTSIDKLENDPNLF